MGSGAQKSTSKTLSKLFRLRSMLVSARLLVHRFGIKRECTLQCNTKKLQNMKFVCCINKCKKKTIKHTTFLHNVGIAIDFNVNTMRFELNWKRITCSPLWLCSEPARAKVFQPIRMNRRKNIDVHTIIGWNRTKSTKKLEKNSVL